MLGIVLVKGRGWDEGREWEGNGRGEKREEGEMTHERKSEMSEEVD